MVSEHLREAIGLPEVVVLEDAAERSAKRHRSFVRKRMGVTYDAVRVREVADEAIRNPAVGGQIVFGGLLVVAAYGGSGREAVCSSPLLWVR
ncbi:hypothetical protein [Nonomuraea sp. NPDC050786]|uniref:hypothetical protein n=1 Tax=Nonomuraea sp. NPDC050786 TaxID=3154840 RepID=UPI0033FF5393